jgi:hypothetical protein
MFSLVNVGAFACLVSQRYMHETGHAGRVLKPQPMFTLMIKNNFKKRKNTLSGRELALETNAWCRLQSG